MMDEKIAGHLDAPRELHKGTGMSLLAPDEAVAPIAYLSASKRAALIACVKGDGTLEKCRGVWKSPCGDSGDRPIFGITVADLSREGMMAVTALGKRAVANLTRQGSWYARTAASEIARDPKA